MLAVSLAACSRSDEPSSGADAGKTDAVKQWFQAEMAGIAQQERATNFVSKRWARLKWLQQNTKWQNAEHVAHQSGHITVVPIDEVNQRFMNKHFNAGRALLIYSDQSQQRRLSIVEVFTKGRSVPEVVRVVKQAALNRIGAEHADQAGIHADLVFYNKEYQHEGSFRLQNGALRPTGLSVQAKSRFITPSRTVASIAQGSSCSTCSTNYLVGYWYDLQTGTVEDYTILTQWDECTPRDAGPTYGDVTNGQKKSDCKEECENAAASMSAQARVVAEKVSEQQTPIDPVRKQVLLKWRVLKGLSWSIFSYETGIKRVIDLNPFTWAWESLNHTRTTLEGIVIGGSIKVVNEIGIPSFTPGRSNVLYAGMELVYDVEFSPLCSSCIGLQEFIRPFTISYRSSAIWAANT